MRYYIFIAYFFIAPLELIHLCVSSAHFSILYKIYEISKSWTFNVLIWELGIVTALNQDSIT